ncbi:MAG: glycosyltransferase [Saprospiraceae bacterium]|nr:glycosyltransferase [Saprospiraceae bacterium]
MGFIFLLWYSLAAIQICYWAVIFQRIAWYKPQKSTFSFSYPGISVIICARNEAANLQKNLESILKQDYPIYEVIVVNDDSDDNTPSLLNRLEQKYTHLKVVTIENKQTCGKKRAVEIGIEKAKFKWVLMTDADCKTSSVNWITEMVNCTENSKYSIVLGYAPYYDTKSIISKWVQFETVYVAIQYLSAAIWKEPYMGVGRNLMYNKSLFYANNGFDEHKHIISGDDDLFINEVATNKNTVICLHKDTYMYSSSPESWKALYKQKRRHYLTSSHYKLRHKFLLGLLSISHFFFYLCLTGFIIANIWNYGIIVIFILRVLLVHLVYGKFMKKIETLYLLPYIFIFDVLIPVYYLLFAPVVLKLNNTQKWK